MPDPQKALVATQGLRLFGVPHGPALYRRTLAPVNFLAAPAGPPGHDDGYDGRARNLRIGAAINKRNMAENDNGPKSGRIPTESLRFDDREQMCEWLKALRDAIDDGIAAGDDATRCFKKRVLSRAEARRKLREAENSIEGLLSLAERALDNK